MNRLQLISLLFAASVCCIASEQARFDNYRVHQVRIGTEEQLQVLQYLEEHPDGYIFWDSPVQTNMELELVVPPHKYSDFEELTTKLNIKTRLRIENFQE